MKIMFSAGEASGDTHGASVAKALHRQYKDLTLFGMGGNLMKEAGVDIVYDIKDLGYIGIVEIVKALPKFFKLRDYLEQIMIERRPDVLVCIDYPGFNMRLMKVAHKLGIPVVYYIAPTIWAWHNSRGKDIKKYVTKVASIFPFEAKAYEEYDCDVDFVGNPLVDIVKPSMTFDEAMSYFKGDVNKRRILLMPGSRKQEVTGLLGDMLEGISLVAKEKEKLQIFLPRAHTIDRDFLESIIAKYDVAVEITEGYNYDLMQICDVAIAASGTATLETALMNLPTILVYRVAPLTYVFAKYFVGIKTVGLPNIMAGRNIIPELIQDEANPKRIAEEALRLLQDESAYRQMKEDLQMVKDGLGEPGAVERVARLIEEVGRCSKALEN